MIWDSTALTTAVHLLVIGSVGYAFWKFVLQNRAAAATATSGGVLLLLAGLSVTMLYFIANLVAMHVFPLFMPMSAAVTAMEHLHREFFGIATLIGVFLISMGFAATNRTLSNTINELRDVRDRQVFAASGTNDGIWDWDIRTSDCSYSMRWKETLGYAEDELEGVRETFMSLLHPADRGGVAKALDAHLTNRIPYEAEYRLRHKDGHYIWVWAKGQAIWDEHGEPVRMGGSICDITERRQAEVVLPGESRGTFDNVILSGGPYDPTSTTTIHG